MINLEDLDIKNTPDEQLEGTRMMLENDMRQLARQRSQNGTYEDAYAGYEALVEEANKAINEALDHQASQLESISGWTWNAQNAAWEKRFTALLSFVSREGHASPSYNHIEDGHNLGSWVSNQRLNYRKNLSPEKIERLESLTGWLWNA